MTGTLPSGTDCPPGQRPRWNDAGPARLPRHAEPRAPGGGTFPGEVGAVARGGTARAVPEERHVPGSRGKAIPHAAAQPSRRDPGAAAPSTRTVTDQAGHAHRRGPLPTGGKGGHRLVGERPLTALARPQGRTSTDRRPPFPAGAHETEQTTERTRRTGRPAPHHVPAFARSAAPAAAATPHGPEAGVRTATDQRLRPTPAASQQPDQADSGSASARHAPESSRRDGSPVLLLTPPDLRVTHPAVHRAISTVAKSA